MLKRFFVFTAVVVLVTYSTAFSEEGEPKSNLKISAIQLENDEKILPDGSLDEMVYIKYKPQIDKALFWHEADDDRIPKGNETSIWLMYNKEGIYFTAHLYYGAEDIRMGKSRSTAPWTNWLQTIGEDYIGFFIDLENSPQGSGQTFVMVNPSNAKWVSIASGKTERLLDEIKSGVLKNDSEVLVEVFMPFSLLIYQGEGEKTVAVNFEMKRQYLDDASYRWCHAGPNNDPSKRGTTIMSLPKSKRSTDFFIDISYIKKKNVAFKKSFQTGLNVRQDITSKWKLVGAISPDIENVAEDIQSIDFSRQELYRQEKRPVLAEGAALVGIWPDFYSRRIKEVEAALNSHGEIGPIKFGALGIMNRESERDFILKTSLTTLGVYNSLGYIVTQETPDSPANQLLHHTLSKKFGGMVDLRANWAGFSAPGEKPAYRGESSVAVFPLGGRISFSQYFVENGLSGNRLGFYGDGPGTRGLSADALFEKVWEKREQGIGGWLRKISTYHYFSGSNYMNGALSERFAQFRYWIQHQRDCGIRCILNLSRYGQYNEAGQYLCDDDWEIDIQPQKLSSPRDKKLKYNLGVNYKGGRQKEEAKHFLKPFCGIELKTGKERCLKANASYEVLRHIDDREQFVVEINYEFSSLSGTGLRLFHNGKVWIPYFAVWKKEIEPGFSPSTYLTIGEPDPYQKEPNKYRIAFKYEFRFNIQY